MPPGCEAQHSSRVSWVPLPDRECHAAPAFSDGNGNRRQPKYAAPPPTPGGMGVALPASGEQDTTHKMINCEPH